MTEPNYSLSNTFKIATSTTSKPISTTCSMRNQTSAFSYTNYVPIGCGTFGTVYKAKCEQTNETVAIKRVFQDVRYKNRELQILQELDHINVIKIKNHFYTLGKTKSNEKYLNVVMDYFPESLAHVIKNETNHSKHKPTALDIKLYSYQMIHGLYYLDCIGVCHRDIKPQNILINQTTKLLQFCDFGSAKKLKQNESNVSYICSRYYRAPELIFNAGYYTNAVDMWSVGCVIAEMVLGAPIFQGNSSIDQLVEIIKVLGTPNKKEILAMNPCYKQYCFPLIKCFTFKEVFEKVNVNLESSFYDLLKQILVYEPQIRITPLKALAHPFFDTLRIKGKVSSNICKILFQFNECEREKDKEGIINRKLIPEWYIQKETKTEHAVVNSNNNNDNGD
jgi:glycogen synthase kinase 3 beta